MYVTFLIMTVQKFQFRVKKKKKKKLSIFTFPLTSGESANYRFYSLQGWKWYAYISLIPLKYVQICLKFWWFIIWFDQCSQTRWTLLVKDAKGILIFLELLIEVWNNWREQLLFTKWFFDTSAYICAYM